MGTLEMLGEEALTPEGRRFLELARQAAEQQSGFIKHLLETFQAELGSLEGAENPRAQAPDIIACARGVLAALNPAFAVRAVTGEIVLAPGLPARMCVAGEKNRLERVFYNLLQNALRYSPPRGKVIVSIRPEGSYVQVSVEDDGPGIPPEIAPQLFQKFVKVGSNSGKAGLGLFFCRITVEKWAGRIACEPRPEGGTRFWFRLQAV
jgi:hypothetical protein